MSEHRAQVDELLADLERSKEQAVQVRRELAGITSSIASPDGLITATVSSRGTLTELFIADDAYRRYEPTELAEQIVRTTAAAVSLAVAEAADVLLPALPSGIDPQTFLGDQTQPSLKIPAVTHRPQLRKAIVNAGFEESVSFAEQNWVEDEQWRRSR